MKGSGNVIRLSVKYRMSTMMAFALLASRRQRIHGSLDSIIDSDRKSLRPIAATAHEVALRTSELLAGLAAIPGVRIFHGVHRAGGELPVLPHAVVAGRRLLLIESVAWPPGCYEIARDGEINCDGVYIGQSVRPLTAAVSYWRAAVPKGHQVSALVIVHAAKEDEILLPAAPADAPIALVRAGNVCQVIQQQLRSGRQSISRHLVATLIAATSDAA